MHSLLVTIMLRDIVDTVWWQGGKQNKKNHTDLNFTFFIIDGLQQTPWLTLVKWKAELVQLLFQRKINVNNSWGK